MTENEEETGLTQEQAAEPFYSDSNISYLKSVMQDVRDGKISFAEHELIEGDK